MWEAVYEALKKERTQIRGESSMFCDADIFDHQSLIEDPCRSRATIYAQASLILIENIAGNWL